MRLLILESSSYGVFNQSGTVYDTRYAKYTFSCISEASRDASASWIARLSRDEVSSAAKVSCCVLISCTWLSTNVFFLSVLCSCLRAFARLCKKIVWLSGWRKIWCAEIIRLLSSPGNIYTTTINSCQLLLMNYCRKAFCDTDSFIGDKKGGSSLVDLLPEARLLWEYKGVFCSSWLKLACSERCTWTSTFKIRTIYSTSR